MTSVFTDLEWRDVNCVPYILPNHMTLLHTALRWRHNGRDGVSNHQPRHCLFNRLFRCRSKKTSKLRVTGLCAGNSPVTGEFPAQMASYAENVSIGWRHHGRSSCHGFQTRNYQLHPHVVHCTVEASMNYAYWHHTQKVTTYAGMYRMKYKATVMCIW